MSRKEETFRGVLDSEEKSSQWAVIIVSLVIGLITLGNHNRVFYMLFPAISTLKLFVITFTSRLPDPLETWKSIKTGHLSSWSL